MKRKLLCAALALTLLLSLGSAAFAESSVWWQVDDDTLIISGTGEMPDYSGTVPPWEKLKKTLEGVEIQSGITHIGSQCFQYCPELTEVSIADSVESIGEAAFFKCTKLKNITLPSDIEEISQQCFDHCGALKSIVIPEGVTVIGNAAFNCCAALQEVTLPASLEEIADSAFNYCPNLKTVYYTGSLDQWESIEIASYNKCLTDASIQCVSSGTPGQTSYGSQSNEIFWELEKDGTLYISGYGEMPDYYATLAPWISQRDKIKAVIIDYGVTRIGQEAFEGCSNIKSVSIPLSVTEIGEAAFFECKKLTDVSLPYTLEELGDQAFDKCAKLRSIVVPEGIDVIGEACFNCCFALEEVTIPASVEEIESSAFNACSKLKSIYYGGSASDWKEIKIRGYNKPLGDADLYTTGQSGSGKNALN